MVVWLSLCENLLLNEVENVFNCILVLSISIGCLDHCSELLLIKLWHELGISEALVVATVVEHSATVS
jgi:hypothetical protein